MSKVIRNSNIEVLRLVLMFMIVMHHLYWHGLRLNENLSVTQESVAALFASFGKISVILFVLISAYFQASKTKLNTKSLLSIWRPTLFYAFTSFILCTFLLKTCPITLSNIWNAIFPILSGTYWFVTAFFLTCLVGPYCNVFLKQVKPQLTFAFLQGSFFFLFVLPTLPFVHFELSNFIYFLYFYCVAAFIRLYIPVQKIKLSFLMTGNSILIIIYLFLIFMGNRFHITILQNLFNIDSPFTLLIALGIFLLCLRLPKKEIPWINRLSACSFAVYLIHDNALLRPLLYGKLFPVRTETFSGSLQILSTMLVDATIILVFCLAIEYCRQSIVRFFHQKKVAHSRLQRRK